MRRPLFTAACAVSASLWAAWVLLAFVHFAQFPLGLGTYLADGVLGLAVLAIIPALWVHVRGRERAARESQRGSCRGCGYDLTGNISGVCPECGQAVPRRCRS